MTIEDKVRLYGMLQKLAAWGGLTSGQPLRAAGASGAYNKEQSARSQEDRLYRAGKWLIPAALGTVAAPFAVGYGAHRLGAKPSTTLKAGLGTALIAPAAAIAAAPSDVRKPLFGF